MQDLNALTQGLESKVGERTEQLRVAHQKLLQTDRLASLGQLAASVAHEINNPLSGVLNLSMLMQRIAREGGIPPGRLEEYRKYQAQVISETARVGRIVQDLLAFSRRSKPQQTSVNLNAMVERTVNLLNHKLKLMGVEAELRLDATLPPVRCDGSQIQQVLVNLVMNGAEAAHGKEQGKIIVTTRRGNGPEEILIVVEDNGEGILPEIREKIFEPFFTTKGEGKGVGLGLAVVYGIVDAHKGSIDFESTPGKGTTFTVTLCSGASVANAAGQAAAVGT
jgi:two-component system NtrC family sensor kinase